MAETQLSLFGDDGGRRVPLASMKELVERSQHPCHACGERATLLPHRMCSAKVNTLILLARGRLEGDGWCYCQEGRGMRFESSGEWTAAPYRCSQHAARLDWMGLVERRGRREGLFRITEKGLRFLRGETTVPARVLCRDGGVRYSSIEEVSVRDISGIKLDKAYWDAYPWSDFLRGDDD